MTVEERTIFHHLQGVTMPVASWDKRFFRSLCQNALSTKEAAQLWRIFIRYRRQMSFPEKAQLLQLAESLAAPDFRKQQAALRDQARIDELKAKYAQAMEPPV